MSESREMVVIIRPSFKKFCGQDACRAALFNHLLYWIAQKAKGQPIQAVKDGEVSWYGTADDICQGLDNSWSINKVRQEIKELVNANLIGQRRNPKNGWDQTRHYFFGEEQANVLREACKQYEIDLDFLGLPDHIIHLLNLLNGHLPKTCNSIYQISEIEATDMVNRNDKSGNAIPKVNAKDTSKDTNRGSTASRASSISQSIEFEDAYEQHVWNVERAAKVVTHKHPSEKERGQVAELVEALHLREVPMEEFTVELIRKSWERKVEVCQFKDTRCKLGNTVTCVPEHIDEMRATHTPEIAPPCDSRADLSETVVWTRYPEQAMCDDPLAYIHLFEEMPETEARHYDYDNGTYGYLTPQEERTIRDYLAKQPAMAQEV